MCRLLDIMNCADDVSCIVITTSFLDCMLAALLSNQFIDCTTTTKMLSHDSGSLNAFSTKADLAYCLGLIPKWVYQNLRLVAEIRNVVAHRIDDYDFCHDDICPRCMHMNIPDAHWTSFGNELDDLKNAAPGTRFQYGAIISLFMLEKRAMEVTRPNPPDDLLTPPNAPS